MRPHALLLFISICLFGDVCSAQSLQPTVVGSSEVPTLTVTAPASPKIVEQQVQEFVQSYASAPNPNVDQVGRWHDPVCVMVIGLPLAEQVAKIKARIVTMAHSLGLPAASSNCKPNVEIAFEDHPQNAMNSVSKNSRVEYLLGYYHLSRANQLKMVRHPIQAWYVTETRSDGVNIGGLLTSQKLPIDLYMRNSNVVDDPENRGSVGCFRRETACTKIAFDNVLIVADNQALQGKNLITVSADIVMLVFSQPKSLDGCHALPSIIDRFANTPCVGRRAPDELTSADRAYLSALYSADLESRKNIEMTDIVSRMAAILGRELINVGG